MVERNRESAARDDALDRWDLPGLVTALQAQPEREGAVLAFSLGAQTRLDVFRAGAVRVTTPGAHLLLLPPPVPTLSGDGATWEDADSVLSFRPRGEVVFRFLPTAIPSSE